MIHKAFCNRPIDIIIPFYKTPALVSSLFQSLECGSVPEELAKLRCYIMVVNDGPGDSELRQCLREAVDRMSARVPCELLENGHNMGFVRSVNRAAQQAVDRGHDVVLLNSDTIVFPSAISEMQNIAYLDPMIGFVSPRSNNATICSLPHQQEYRALTPAESYTIFRQIAPYLPGFHFAPTAVGFCLFIKWEVMKEFGLLDERYGLGYNEENDLIMRANRCGYRAALANRAWVYHLGNVSFASSPSSKPAQEASNAALLEQRYPEYRPSVRAFLEGPIYQAERLLTGLLPDQDGRLDLVFDLSSVGPYYNGTAAVCRELLQRAATLWQQFNIYVMVSEDARRFHELERLPRVTFVPPEINRPFAVGFRFGQPFGYDQLFRLSRLAVVNVFGMPDPIALDCLYLNNDADLETMWGAVFAHADGIVYISDFVRDLFHRRFSRRNGLREMVAYLSLYLADYRKGPIGAPGAGKYVLVIGNKFEHKRVRATVDALSRAFPDEKTVVLGDRYECGRNVNWRVSGEMPEAEMRELWSGARFVVFPSVYEGFGLPVAESLAYQKPVLARSIPVMRAIQEKIGERENLILYSSTDELIKRLKNGFPTWRARGQGRDGDQSDSWDSITERIGEFLSEAVKCVDFEGVLVPRLRHMQLLERARQAASDQPVTLCRLQAQLATAHRDHEEQIREIRGSWSWRLTAPMRWAGSAYLQLRNAKVTLTTRENLRRPDSADVKS